MRRSRFFLVVFVWLGVPQAFAQEKLCDASVDNCRIPLISLIQNERVGIDVGVWFFKDTRIVQELINAWHRGVPVRMLMDVRANLTYPANRPLLAELKAAGIPMRKRTAGDILHWKLMIFAGQGQVEWSGANFSPMAFMPGSPYVDYEDEIIYYSHELVPSFMTMFDDIWTNTRDHANYANVNGPLQRHLELVSGVGRQPARGQHLHRRRSGRRLAERVPVRRAAAGLRAEVDELGAGPRDRDQAVQNAGAAAPRAAAALGSCRSSFVLARRSSLPTY